MSVPGRTFTCSTCASVIVQEQEQMRRHKRAILSIMEVLWTGYELAVCVFSQSPTELQQCPHWMAKTRTLRRQCHAQDTVVTCGAATSEPRICWTQYEIP